MTWKLLKIIIIQLNKFSKNIKNIQNHKLKEWLEKHLDSCK